jgi:glucose-fructose oxidoreductase
MAELEKNDDIDIVYSITPPLIHHRDVIAGARAGKHVICEKPMTVSVAKCEEMIEACEKAGVKLAMGYRLHYHPYCEQLKKTAADAAWGGPVKMKGGFGSRMATIGWRTSKELAGGGQLMNIGIYVINAALMASGEVEPVSISATEPPKTKPEQFKDFEETIDFRLEFPDGSRCDGTSSGVISSNFFNATAPDKTYDFNPAYSYSGIRMSVDGESVAPVDEFNQQAHQMDAFAAHILFGKPNIVPGEMGLRDMRIITAIYESSRLGKPVRLASI